MSDDGYEPAGIGTAKNTAFETIGRYLELGGMHAEGNDGPIGLIDTADEAIGALLAAGRTHQHRRRGSAC